ncbi:MAG: hypothetical protein NTY76_05670 [Candidatus Omnitrophica bacterium]|nr:hypothetical protein [Candidatus Omnitrophota bacterium]
MKMRDLFIVLIMLACAVMFSGCGHIETYGERISNRNSIPIKDIVSHPEQYVGKTVTVKGKIALECDTGCWFNIKDGAAVIYTDIQPYGFAIPQKVGHSAMVEGTVSVEKGKLTLTGKAVEIR